MDQRTRRLITQLAAVTALVVTVDLATKTLPTLTPQQVPGIEPVTNPGLALGIANPATAVVIAMAVAGLVLFGGWCIQRTVTHQLPAWPTGLLLGGAAANLIDRVVFSTVRDFIATPWVIFNLADVALIVGITAFFLHASKQRTHQPDELRRIPPTPAKPH